ncbi:hypothetical protein B0J13DRAFT_194836 [Dactylonectria estremocensis]|uniref:Uncharacterized protein n=1 Tax=Dactylonectria estremocensis TaxID=1079267 RepID=A0A9P9DHV0_9HYPO|nr:hypothetical protein B0J13DRAFT_194836 [Dactylonectria estremocensis]
MVESQGDRNAEIERLLERLIERLPRPENVSPSQKWLKEFLPTFIILFGLSSLIIFTAMPTVVKDDKIRTFLSLAWLFFMAGFALCCMISSQACSRGIRRRLQHYHCENIVVEVICGLLQIATALAFLFLSLVVVAYTAPAGWIAFGVSCFCVMAVLVCLVIDLCW